ncbi:hypothetical protein BT63DRAFT_429111 [Microthyrium microscopicum]|uniref:Uncharacterized protein n=1 Tax=Microthyrium microscopicum TaxID=703497 RepID=A0A6A6U2K1_9PEZI|nr:hypothetical protein BT63DRAFT_429111 [Microthyrium microscopicum]
MMGPRMMGGPQMLNQQTPMNVVPVANCPHKRRHVCKSCRRGLPVAAYNAPMVQPMGYNNVGFTNGAYSNNNMGQAVGYNNAGYMNGRYNNGGYSRRRGPIGLIIGGIVDAVQSHQEKKKDGKSRDMTQEPVYDQHHQATRSDPVLLRQVDVSDSEDEEDLPPRYSSHMERDGQRGVAQNQASVPEKVF